MEIVDIKNNIGDKLFELMALSCLKNKGFIDEKNYKKVKEEIEKEYFIKMG